MNDERIIGQHGKIPMRLDRHLIFCATMEDGTELKEASAEALRGEIDAYTKAKYKAERTPLGLAVITVWGDRGTVVGIHMGTSQLRGFAELSKAPAVYPALPWIVATLVEMEAARAALRRLDELLRPYKIDTSRAYGRVKADQYERLVEHLESEYMGKRARAEEAAP